MPASFSILTQPWIPCAEMDGTLREYGLRDALVNAHRLRGVESANPLETASILRLMLAVLHRVFPSENAARWVTQWKAGQWNTGALDAYFHQWGDRFDLFHPTYPFFQSRDDRLPPRSIARLFPGWDAATWFNHEIDDESLELTPAEAARGLVAFQAFGLPGIRHPQLKMFFSGAPWLAGMIFFVEGNTLFETLALNWLRYAPNHPRENLDQTSEDRPIWERDDPFTPDRETPLGYLDYLTFPNRRTFLIPEETPDGIRVRQMIDGPGLKLRAELHDPFKHHVKGEKGLIPLYLNPAKSLWRNSSSLFSIRADGIKPIESLTFLAERVYNGDLEPHQRYRLISIGMVSDKAKAELMRMERMPLPVQLLGDEAAVAVLSSLLDRAEDVRKTLWFALFRLAEQMIALTADSSDSHKPALTDTKKLVAHWSVEPIYWQNLENPFLRLMNDLADGSDSQQVEKQWQAILKKTAWSTLDSAIAMAGDTPQALKAAVLARGQLGGGLKKLFPSDL